MKTRSKYVLSAVAMVAVLVLFLLLRAHEPAEVTKPEHNPEIEDVAPVAKAADAETPPSPEPTPMTPPAVSAPSLSSTVNQDVVVPVNPTLLRIIEAVKETEDRIKDLRIEYTCTRRPCGVQEDWTPSADEEYPGRYKLETGVWTQKGEKVRLNRTYFDPTSTTKQIYLSLAYNGADTKRLEDRPEGPDFGLISAGRSHKFRTRFNPLLSFAATGDKKLSEELTAMDAELADGLHDVSDAACNLVRLYKKSSSGKRILRTFNVYLDPHQNYAVRKVEKYWYDFLCPERTVEVKEFTTIDGVPLASKVACVTYQRPHRSDTSYPLFEQQLDITSIQLNQGIQDSEFEIAFGKNVKVWDDVFKLRYSTSGTVPDQVQ
ncbi:MAG: hypothetical protein ACYST6_07135 [Planctomycetota bacterium]